MIYELSRPSIFLCYCPPEPSTISQTPHSHLIVLRHGNILI